MGKNFNFHSRGHMKRYATSLTLIFFLIPDTNIESVGSRHMIAVKRHNLTFSVIFQ